MAAWISAVSALAGAVIGAGSALFSQRLQWRQQVRKQDRDTRRELYAAYLTALHETAENLRAISSGYVEPANGDFRRSAYDSFQAGALYSLQAQIVIMAPDEVAGATSDSLTAMRTLRDRVAQGPPRGSKEPLERSEEYKADRGVMLDKNEKLRETMQTDLRQPF